MADSYPVISEFGPGSCTCTNGIVTGCTVCSTAAILRRNGIALPSMRTLGVRMGARHRSADGSVFHGLSLSSGAHCQDGTWCAFCGYLELKANHVAVAYGRLTTTQFRAHAKAFHPMMVRGRYGALPIVKNGSYSATVPARGRVDSGFTGAHMMVVWGAILEADGDISAYIVSDPDFGSSAHPVVPPHSIIARDVLERFWNDYGQSAVTYMVTRPDALTGGTNVPPKPKPPLPAGTVLRYGGRLIGRGRYVLLLKANVRTSPYIKSGNAKAYAKGTTFRCGQTTYAGTNVGGSTTWHGTSDGRHWIHESVARAHGHSTGKETIR